MVDAAKALSALFASQGNSEMLQNFSQDLSRSIRESNIDEGIFFGCKDISVGYNLLIKMLKTTSFSEL